MTKRTQLMAVLAMSGAVLAPVLPANAATILDWNTSNVVVGVTPPDGLTGFSTVYDGSPADPTSTTSGRIAFTPPEAVSPGIKVQPETYTQGGPAGITLDGCLMTSNPSGTCTSPFQSGKRIKKQMTGLGPVDLVFDVQPGTATSVYQVFDRIINATGAALAGFAIELGYGVGSGFVAATDGGPLTFSSLFLARPTGSGPVSTQFPFGLSGDATDNPNFSLDGFFAPERTGLSVDFASTKLTSTGFYGPYPSLFGNWLSQDAVPQGAFWDNDGNPLTDALLMAWLNPATGLWELRREVLDLGAGLARSLTGTDVLNFATFDALNVQLGLGSALVQDVIEDLANLNVNYAIQVGDLGRYTSFTLRTTVFAAPIAPVPLPAGAGLLAVALGGLALVRRRSVRVPATVA